MPCSGFGEVGLQTSFWLGLDPLHQLTSYGGYSRMRVEMYATDNRWYSAEYDEFFVGGEYSEYPLSVYGYSGDAGDHLYRSNGLGFSTSDSGLQSSLAMMMKGGWWYSGSDYASLNGVHVITGHSNEMTGFYWNSPDPQPGQPPYPPTTSSLVGVSPGRLEISRIMVTKPSSGQGAGGGGYY